MCPAGHAAERQCAAGKGRGVKLGRARERRRSHHAAGRHARHAVHRQAHRHRPAHRHAGALSDAGVCFGVRALSAHRSAHSALFAIYCAADRHLRTVFARTEPDLEDLSLSVHNEVRQSLQNDRLALQSTAWRAGEYAGANVPDARRRELPPAAGHWVVATGRRQPRQDRPGQQLQGALSICRAPSLHAVLGAGLFMPWLCWA